MSVLGLSEKYLDLFDILNVSFFLTFYFLPQKILIFIQRPAC